MCRKYPIPCNDKWYDHLRADKVAENDEVKLLWDFHCMQTDHVKEARRPDIVLVKKKVQPQQ